jgi:hypothetical protein
LLYKVLNLSSSRRSSVDDVSMSGAISTQNVCSTTSA